MKKIIENKNTQKTKGKNILNTLLQTKDAHEATKLLNLLKFVIPHLVREGDTENLSMIGFTLAKMYKTSPPINFPGRRERIMEVLVGAAEDGILDNLVKLDEFDNFFIISPIN